jgi:4-hydroxythreonine-4-phosphate dehydrogenase
MTAPRIAIVADDLTGAADTAAGLLALGRPLVTWARDGRIAWQETDRIVAVDATTRHITPDAAADTVRGLASRFRLGGFDCLYKKVDSTLRGHVAVEVQAALDGWYPGARAVIAPAFPAMGRTTIGGRQHLDNAPIDGASIAEMLAAVAMPVTHVTLDEVRDGRLDRILRAQPSQGAVVCDAISDADLAAIAAAGAALGERVVWVGSGGLARNMFTGQTRTNESRASATVTATGPVLIVCGSQTTVSAAQAASVASEGAIAVPVNAGALSSGSSALRSTGSEIEDLLRRGADVLVTIEGTRASDADPALVDRLGQMLAPCRALSGGLVATGGDTASAILRHWGISALQLIAEAEAGVPLAMADGVTPVVVALKAGGFGNAGTLAAARAAVRSLLQCKRG